MSGPVVSIVVPARDEADNLPDLITRIHRSVGTRWVYELLVVNDSSVDGTAAVVTALAATHPVTLVHRTHSPGKGLAIAEGFGHATGDVLCMIDADLQYPPEALPAMVSIVLSGAAEVVVANRVVHDTSLGRRLLSRLSRWLLQRLHGLDVDVQSGLKVLRRTVLDQIELRPNGWAFDLELLLDARAAGHTITGHDIDFARRTRGRTKINVLLAGWQVLRNAIWLRLTRDDSGTPDTP